MRKKDKLRLEALNNKFDKENVTAPDSLSVPSVKTMLQNKDSGQKKLKLRTKKRNRIKTAAAMAACFAIVLTSVTAVNAFSKPDVYKPQHISSCISYAQIKNKIKNPFQYGVEMFQNMNAYKYATMTEESSKKISVASDTAVSKTNIQVDGVSEADVVNTDGKCLYWMTDKEINIYSADKEKSKLLSTIDAKNECIFTDFYLAENKLIALCCESRFNDCTDDYFYGDAVDHDKTIVCVYDVSNASAPKPVKEFKQSGGYNSSRMVDNYLYVASIKYVYDVDSDDDEGFFPYATDNDGNYGRIECKSINTCPQKSADNYFILSAIDINSDKQNIETKALLGSADDIYCSNDYLYVFSSCTDSYFDRKNKMFNLRDYTQIVKVDYNKLDINFVCATNVDGKIHDQYSVDEKDGNLRVALTANAENDVYNVLVVLDENLNKIGETKKFAKGESIQSARFIQDYAYVITFEQTDPLFVIDLKNPKAPVIKGHAEISGFSSVLLPVDENTILGIGYETEEEYDFVSTKTAVKLALFDVSSPEKPKVLTSRVYDNVESDAQLSIKGLLINKQDNYFAFAYNTPGDAGFEDYYDEQKDEYVQKLKDGFVFEQGIVVFEIKNNKIVQTNHFKTDNPLVLTRCVYVDDVIYTVAQNDGVQYFEMK